MTEENKQYFNTKEAAEFLGFSPRTLANYRYRNIGPDYNVVRGKRIYERKALIDWIKRNNSLGREKFKVKMSIREEIKDFEDKRRY